MKTRYWWPSVLWMVIVFLFSTDLFAAPKTESVFQEILRWLFPWISEPTVGLIHNTARKCAHVFSYAILSWFCVMGLKKSFRVTDSWTWKTGIQAIALTVMYAALDECHQSFVPSRTGSIVDVGWDALGAVLAQVIIQRLDTRRSRVVKI